MSTRVFFIKFTDVINNLAFLNDTNIIETQIYNLRNISQFAIQFLGALKPHKSIMLNPYLKLLNIHSNGNQLAEFHNVADNQKYAFESGLSAIVSFKNEIFTSLLFQYHSPKTACSGPKMVTIQMKVN